MFGTAVVSRVARAVAVVSALALTGVVVFLVPQSGISGTRLALHALVPLVAWAGVVSLYRDAPGASLVASVTLVFLGIWQTAIWVVVFPAAASLALAALLAGDELPPADAGAAVDPDVDVVGGDEAGSDADSETRDDG